MGDDGVRLRPVRKSDEAFLLRLYASTREEELSALDWDAQQKSAFVRMQYRAQRASYEAQYRNAELGLVEKDGEPIGRFLVNRSHTEIRVIDISLLPEWRNRGIGGGLMRQVQEEGARDGVSVTLHVEKSNQARRLYERLGFVEREDRGVYALMQWNGPESREGVAHGPRPDTPDNIVQSIARPKETGGATW